MSGAKVPRAREIKACWKGQRCGARGPSAPVGSLSGGKIRGGGGGGGGGQRQFASPAP